MGAEMGRIDLSLDVDLPPQNYGFDEGASDFLLMLKQLRRIPGFDVDWFSQWEENGNRYRISNDVEGYLSKFRAHNEKRTESFSIWAHEYPGNDESDANLYGFRYSWYNRPLSSIDMLSGEVYRPHPEYGTDPQLYINLIAAVTAWKRPQHLAFGPGVYMRDHHPLDRSRAGIRWMGWVPFDLTPNDVPEAALVRPMNGGTLIVTQMRFWQAWEANPDYSREAIERAQEVEIRLNLLGVLPTNIELERGDWGQ